MWGRQHRSSLAEACRFSVFQSDLLDVMEKGGKGSGPGPPPAHTETETSDPDEPSLEALSLNSPAAKGDEPSETTTTGEDSEDESEEYHQPSGGTPDSDSSQSTLVSEKATVKTRSMKLRSGLDQLSSELDKAEAEQEAMDDLPAPEPEGTSSSAKPAKAKSDKLVTKRAPKGAVAKAITRLRPGCVQLLSQVPTTRDGPDVELEERYAGYFKDFLACGARCVVMLSSPEREQLALAWR